MQMFGRRTPLSCTKITLSSRGAGRLRRKLRRRPQCRGDQVVRETPFGAESCD
ncbi:hypothetical protein I79_004951 [Cricetulus griseus]|uniref:Uncharacterized protein n=1 Tax=Cricetulus griseus TaxID=10029 RepID=G3H3W1_CRIGR|nr:hypothetical protein I79_004951 [Cricetulus griseus]